MDIYIETMGCPKNVNDSEAAAGILERAGHKVTGDISGAGAVIVNTCGFIDDAKRESISKIFELARMKDENAMLIVSGCLSQRYGDRIFKMIPEVDVFIGVNDYINLPGIIENFKHKREKHFSPCGDGYIETPSRKFLEKPVSTTLKIADGCDNICAYCVIPEIRGGYRSRDMENIVTEAASLAAQGCKELIIVAQDVTAYGIDIYGRYELPALLRRLCKIEGIRWIRLMYCYEDRITDELIETMRDEEKICKYIDMPVQHCSDKILNAMNRRSSGESIVSTIGRLRAAMPDIHIRTTLITGFPGESGDEFSELLDFVREMEFERLGVFAYSKEDGTIAAEMKPQVRKNVKEARRDAILLSQLEISRAKNAEKTGGSMNVFVEGRESEGVYYGRTEYDAPEIDNSVVFTSHNAHVPGDIVKVEITDSFDYDLAGREVEP